MTPEDRLKRTRDSVDAELVRILEKGDGPLHRAMRYSVLSGGKRFRPLLMISSGEFFQAEPQLLLSFACAMEMIHNYSIIHDDMPCMDNDDLRRGKPSTHRAFGEDMALLAGDGLLSLAFDIMARTEVPSSLMSRKERAVREISHRAGLDGMIGGQVLDITLDPENLNEEELLELLMKKTGGLIIASVVTGGILGGASRAQLDALKKFGECVGLAFQMRDDIQDALQDGPEKQPPRPNTVHFYGAKEARERLQEHIDAAQGILHKASIDSEGLRHLAQKLLVLKDDPR